MGISFLINAFFKATFSGTQLRCQTTPRCTPIFSRY